MKPLGEVFVSIQKITNRFDGIFSIKNSQRQYLFVNHVWLTSKKFHKEDIIGKTDDEIFSPGNANAILARVVDLEALEKKTPLDSTINIILNGKPVCYFTIKWVVSFEEILFLCSLGDIVENKEKVLAFRNEIDAFYKTEVVRC